jgi:hypothetical protein
MDKLSYGVTAIVGDYFVGKLRVSNELFDILEKFMNSNGIQYSVIIRNRKENKKGVVTYYVHFSYIMNKYHLNKVMVMTRERRIRLIQDEINTLRF